MSEENKPITKPSPISIKTFQPRGLEEPKDSNRITIKSFTPSRFSEGPLNDYGTVAQTYGSLASTDEKTNSKFNLHADTKKYLGVEQEERSHLEAMIAAEVEQRIKVIKDEAYKEGFNKGTDEGKAEAKAQLSAQITPKLELLEVMLGTFDRMKQEMFEANEKVLISLLFNIGKQVMLRELKVDREYLKRLCLQMIEKIGIRDHLKIKVSRVDQSGIDELKEFLKTQYTDLKNFQIEVSDEVELGGCKIETNLIWINASIETQMKAIEETLKE